MDYLANILQEKSIRIIANVVRKSQRLFLFWRENINNNPPPPTSPLSILSLSTSVQTS